MLMKRIISLLLLLGMIFQCSGCSAPKSRAAREVSEGVTQAELQQDVQRFSSVLIDRVGQATEQLLLSQDPIVREAAIRRALAYYTNVVEIVSGSSPELALLDMVVFISLSRYALESYWIPRLIKDEGKMLATAFEKSEREIWTIAAKVVTPENISKLRDLIARWQRETPGQYRVEGVRFGEFSKYAGRLATEREKESGGLLANVSKGVEAVDQALLTTDRVMYLVQRIPYLLRLHAILGTGEVLGSVSNKLAADASIGQSARGTMTSMITLTQLAGQAAREGRELVEAMHPLVLPNIAKLGGYLNSSNHLAAQTVTILDRITAATWQVVLVVIAGGMAFAVTWGAVYYYVKRRLLLLSHELDERNSETRKAA